MSVTNEPIFIDLGVDLMVIRVVESMSEVFRMIGCQGQVILATVMAIFI